jgi:hypothetical protein
MLLIKTDDKLSPLNYEVIASETDRKNYCSAKPATSSKTLVLGARPKQLGAGYLSSLYFSNSSTLSASLTFALS